MKDRISRAEAEELFSLDHGDHVKAVDRMGRRWQGTVETSAPELGILWLRTTYGERKLIDIQEHTIERMSVAGANAGRGDRNRINTLENRGVPRSPQ